MASDDDEGDAQPKTLIYDVRRHVQEVRSQFYEEQIGGSVSLQTRRQLAAAAVTYYDVLWEHRDEGAVGSRWDDAGVDWIRNALGATRTVQVATPGDTANTRTEERPALQAIDPTRVVDVTKRLDEIAKALGFTASTRDHTPDDEATVDDLRALLTARGQEAAAERLPGSPDAAVTEADD
jgi:hypothetical protein